MRQTILIDNDALLKLARYGLFDETIAMFEYLFGSSSIDVYILPTAKYVLLPTRNRLRICQDEESAARLEAFFRTCKLLDARSADPDMLDLLNDVQNIDPGEAILLAISATNRNTLLITGDKRSLAALCSHDSVTQVSEALAGRVFSMEVLFLYLINDEFSHIQKCVRDKLDVDKALSIVFGMTIPASFDSVQEGLTSYIRHLRSVTGGLLHTPSG